MLAILLFLLFPSLSFAQMVDYKCVSDCSARGYMYGYCQSACSYGQNVPSSSPADMIPVFQSIKPMWGGIQQSVESLNDYFAKQAAMREQSYYGCLSYCVGNGVPLENCKPSCWTAMQNYSSR